MDTLLNVRLEVEIIDTFSCYNIRLRVNDQFVAHMVRLETVWQRAACPAQIAKHVAEQLTSRIGAGWLVVQVATSLEKKFREALPLPRAPERTNWSGEESLPPRPF